MALQLPTTARSVQTQPRTAHALPGLRRGAPQRPNRARKRESRTAADDRPQCRRNLANAMIESSRRHGHFDPRRQIDSSRPPSTLLPAAEDGGLSIQVWENEGGRFSATNRSDAPAGLDWYAFCSRYFPGRRRHDLEALKAYEAYRSGATAPKSAPRRGSRAVTRRPAHPSARSRVSPLRGERLAREAALASIGPDIAKTER
jgi:hypothetical protein